MQASLAFYPSQPIIALIYEMAAYSHVKSREYFAIFILVAFTVRRDALHFTTSYVSGQGTIVAKILCKLNVLKVSVAVLNSWSRIRNAVSICQLPSLPDVS